MESFTTAFIFWQYNRLSVIVKIWQENAMRRAQDNPGSVKDAVKDIMIAGTGLVDMINNSKHQPWLAGPGKWVSLMIPSPPTPASWAAGASLRQDHRYNYCRAKYKMATHARPGLAFVAQRTRNWLQFPPRYHPGLKWTCHIGGWGQILSI